MHIDKLPFYARYSIVAVCLVFTVMIMREASPLLIPLFAGLLLAILLLPVVKFLERIHVNRGIASLLAVLCFVVLLVMVNYFLTSEISGFSKELPNINNKIQGIFTSLQQWITVRFRINNAQQKGYLSGSFSDIINWMSGLASKLFLSFGNILIWFLFVCVYAFCILYYRRLLVRFVMKLVEKDYHDEMPAIIHENKKVIRNYMVGLMAEFAIMLLLNSSVLLLLGIKYALLLAIIASLLNIIPYIGIYTAIALSMLVTYASSSGSAAVTVGIVLLGIHLIDALILLPRIVGSRMKMNPFITIVAVIAGDIVWGIPGMFLFIPLAAMLRIVFEHIASLEAWAILFGEEEKKMKKKKAQ
ncbi:MAG: AI-2E family transporter [Sediminibacterium sp.]